MLQVREFSDKGEFDGILDFPDVPFTQRSFFGEWQKTEGRSISRVAMFEGGEPVAKLQAITIPAPLGMKIVSIPHGPVLGESAGRSFCGEYYEEIIGLLKKEGAAFGRFDAFPPNANAAFLSGLNKHFKRAPEASYQAAAFQPKTEWVLDIGRKERELLSGMHKKARYGIRLAEENNVAVEIISGGFMRVFGEFYEMLRETGRRDGFYLHKKRYYEAILQNTESAGNAFFAAAKRGGKTLSMHFIILSGNYAYYLLGASKTEGRKYNASYAAHWNAILEAKKRGAEIFNSGAIESKKSRGGRLGSITQYKKRFGGRELEYGDSLDVVYRPLYYRLYMARKITQALWRK